MDKENIYLVAEDDNNIRLDRWFRHYFPKLKHGRLEKLLRTGQVRVDSQRVKSNFRLSTGERIRLPPKLYLQEVAYKQVNLECGEVDQTVEEIRKWVLYKDEDLIAINKPAGLSVQGGTKIFKHVDGMLDGLRYDRHERPKLVHRIDRYTSGVLLLARSRSSARRLTSLFRSKDIYKTYWALTAGIPAPKEGIVDVAVKKTTNVGGEQLVLPSKNGQRAITHYRTLEVLGNKIAWLSLHPVTGRTHQLRTHCAEVLECPIYGDKKYMRILPERLDPNLNRQLHLHARSIEIPLDENSAGQSKKLKIVAPLPEHMLSSWSKLGFEVNNNDDFFKSITDSKF